MPHPTLTAALDRVAAGEDLERAEAAGALEVIMAGEASEAEIAGLLIGLRAKGETVAELAGLAETMRRLATPVTTQRDDLVDTAGTGGGLSTFNISTTAALVAAGAGCAVAKHGNRSATSRSGSADVLEALGARIDLDADAVGRCIREAGFGFMFAPSHHAATRFVVPVRKALAVRTIFNFLGPLTNPAGARRQVIGVSELALVDVLAGALRRLGTDRALVVSSADGLDEMSISAPTHVVEVEGDDLKRYDVDASELGIAPAAFDELVGGDPAANAATTQGVLSGEDRSPRRSLSVLNAGAAIYAAGKADSIAEGARAAESVLDDGRALAALEGFVAKTQDLAPPQ